MLTTIPAQDVRPGDEISPFKSIATRIKVLAVATIDGRTHIVERRSGVLRPPMYNLPADALVSRYSAR